MLDYTTPYDSRRSPVFGRNMVATSQPLAAQAGLEMLRAGGNAIDAAITAAAVLSVVEPTNNGLGGDAFAILWDGQALHGLNASGRAPAAWSLARFTGMGGIPKRGWDSVTVPGVVSGWAALAARFGRRSLAQCLAPAVRIAREGFHLTPGIAEAWARGARELSQFPGFAETFLPGGRAPRAGEIFRNPDIAATLELIGASGGEAFYRGALAERIVAASKAQGGLMRAEDLAGHEAEWCGTLSTSVFGVEAHEIPPNSQGIAALMALGMLARTDIARHHPDSPEAIHLAVEALKLAFADVHHHVAEPGAMQLGPEALLDPDYLRARAGLIDPARAQIAPVGAPRQGGTVYLSAADADGRMVSLIQSNYAGFGSGVVVPGTGIHLQNRATGFTLEPGHPNCLGPGKRPFHTIIPGLVMKAGRPFLSYGVMGGPVQAQGHVQLVLRTVLAGQNPQAAIDARRFRFISERKLALEEGIAPATGAALAALGHEIVWEAQKDSFGFGGGQMILALDEGYVGGSDWRRDGQVAGY